MRRIFILLLLISACHTQAQTFPCDGSFYITLFDSNTGPTNAFQIDYNGSNVDFNLIEDFNIGFNSIGFNRLDNYIYAIRVNTNDVIRLKSDGTFETVGEESSISNWVSGAGDCRPDGVYWAHHRLNQTFYSYNVVGGFSQVDEIQCTWHPSTGNTGILDLDLDDIAFDPTDENSLYTYQRNYSNGGEPVGTRGHLLRIDIDPNSITYKQVFSMGEVPVDIIRHLGAMFFDYDGNLYAYGSLAPLTFINQKRLVQIDKTNGATVLIGEGPSAANNDGCSCAFNLNLKKAAFPAIGDCSTPSFDYQFEVTNASNIDLADVSFTDVLPTGMDILSISVANPFGGNIQANSGVGFESLIINDISIAVGATLAFSITVSNPGSGEFNNQAILTGIPAELGGQVVSDDPNTPEFEDMTTVIVEDFDFGADLVINSGSAVNCDSLDTGYMGISAEHILPNTEYFLSYFDPNLMEIVELTIVSDDEGYVRVSNLLPGVYEFTEFGPTEGCVAAVSFTGLISYPNISGQFSAGGTSQVCEGGTILLGVTADPDATYDWSGPDDFISNELNFSIENVALSDAGTYYVLVEKFGCFKEDSITVTVFEALTVDLGDDTSYCVGQNALLMPDVIATSAVDYFWSTLSIQASETVFVTDLYTVRVTDDNGCSDKDSIYIEFLPAPILDLGADQYICELEDLVLSAGTDLSYNYAWSNGSETASIIPNNYGEYAVTVSNEGCIVADTIMLNYVEIFDNQLDTNAELCEGDSLWLVVNDAGATYEWSTGSSNDSLLVTTAGEYWVAISEGECVERDTIDVFFSETPFLDFPNDMLICQDSTLFIDASGSGAASFEWQDGIALPFYEIETSGTYSLIASNGDCIAEDSIVVSFYDCTICDFYIPNAFTPNLDGVNDDFKAYTNCELLEYQFQIFDRWGGKVYEGNDINRGWNGINKDKKAQVGVYAYLIIVTYEELLDVKSQQFSGDVTLIR